MSRYDDRSHPRGHRDGDGRVCQDRQDHIPEVPGDALERRHIPAGRQKAPADRKQIDQDQSEHEAGHGHQEHGRGRRRQVSDRAAPQRGVYSGGGSDNAGEQEGPEAQKQTRRSALRDYPADGPAVAQRFPEVSVEHAAQPVHVLL